ncbi:gliding motility-associated C-terminal domain-containing protein [Cnuella takakiae]|uniref:Gliding motility-associated C-terminal domain-containing protein n=1 Tax=Cnuella takakiae TaxID=1302690 RepID=A0A1M4YK26_9BACT|nr:gliding motility-associated C-terminal domain-containing protein [Cnuella takakiae]OLY93175.1 hypothetical protein BUE76_15730 [Cnuella takakiae]SHF06047.1 gliding motility-associated C-terminal domain-containing protein [Cnuella takakiae]
MIGYFRKVLLLVSLLFLLKNSLLAQLCTGSLGDPVVNLTFGNGANPGPPSSFTNMSFFATDCPNDGQYTIRSNTQNCFQSTWHSLLQDHTGDPNGYMMLVNASFQPSDFYVQKVGGLCGNTTYEFAAWVMNLMRNASCFGGPTINPDLTFSIETPTGAVLASRTTGQIAVSAQPKWEQIGMFFTTPPGTSEVIMRLRNNAPGGCGNDLAIDDITFRPCGAKLKTAIEGISGNRAVLCEGAPTSFRFTAAITSQLANPEMQWQESRDSGRNWVNIQGAQTTTYTWNNRPAGNYLYRVLVADRGNINSLACRIASQPLEVRVRAKPRIELVAATPFCVGTRLNISGRINWVDTSNGTYNWRQPAGGSLVMAQKDSGSFYLLHAGKVAEAADSGWYRLEAVSGAGCTAADSVRIQLLARPAASIQLPTLACQGTTTELAATASQNAGAIAGWQWSWPGQTSSAQRLSLRFDSAMAMDFRLVALAQNGCYSDTATATLVVHAQPVAGFLMPEVCLTDPFAQFSNTSTIADGTPLRFNWRFGDPANPAAGSTLANAQYRFSRTGVYAVGLTVTSAAGCTADTVQQFTVNGAAPKAGFSLGTTGLICSADTVVLRNESTVDFGNITRLVIRWNNNDNPAEMTVDEAPFAGKTYPFVYSTLMRGLEQKFTIRFTAYSGIGCVQELTREITVNQSPQALMTAISPLCANAPAFVLQQGSEQGGLSGTGVYLGAGVSGTDLFDPLVAGAGLHPIAYQFTTTAGCRDTAEQTIRVYPVPQVSAGSDLSVLVGGSITLQGSANGSGLRYLWTPPTDLSNPAVLQPLARPRQDRSYLLTAISPDGCSASDEMKVTVVNELYIPNAFSPNGDGLNDSWQVPFLESVAGAELRVFNRYGELVFFTTGKGRWDGRHKGADLPAGIYVYQVRYNGLLRKGTVMLVR